MSVLRPADIRARARAAALSVRSEHVAKLRDEAAQLAVKAAAIAARLDCIELHEPDMLVAAPERIVRFLREHPAQQFSIAEIKAATLASDSSTRMALKRLHKRGPIERVGWGEYRIARREP